jgi:formate dehydrogenase major subunit
VGVARPRHGDGHDRRPHHRTRAETWEDETEDGKPLNRTRGFMFLGGATLDSEENYLIKKGFTALGAIAIENQARI